MGEILGLVYLGVLGVVTTEGIGAEYGQGGRAGPKAFVRRRGGNVPSRLYSEDRLRDQGTGCKRNERR